jgi:hypothetical protein
MNKVPNPGSEKARNKGCTCPVIDNHYGRGYCGDGEMFIYNMDCPIHKDMETKNPD